MSRAVIRLGDETSHGGRVISASAQMTIDGIPVALWGDHCSCPHDGQDNCVICEGEPQAMYDGIPVALEGHKTSCGATLIASQLTRCHVSLRGEKEIGATGLRPPGGHATLDNPLVDKEPLAIETFYLSRPGHVFTVQDAQEFKIGFLKRRKALPILSWEGIVAHRFSTATPIVPSGA